MPITNRPYIGTWQLNQQEVRRYTPDAKVYINGLTTISGCPTCGGRIDLQQYITTVSVDPTTEGIATANVTLQLPRSAQHAFFVDGQFKLQTGMEIHIYFRGYFPVKGRFAGITTQQTGGIDVSGAVVYPYYHVFHGVVTEVSHEYSGGEHTASLSCADLLHFWQYQRIATSGAVFGSRPKGSQVALTLVGSHLAGMTPYSIVYSMYRQVMGAVGGVEFALSSGSNVGAMSSTGNETSVWAMAQLYWQKRFTQQFNSLRMYGMNGSLYNAFDQAFLGRLSTKDSDTLVTQFADPAHRDGEHEPMQNLYKAARALGYDPVGTYAGGASEEDAKKGGLGINVNQMQAFYHDISAWGNPNMFETEYQTKLEIVEAVKNVTGFEFYQDVDGDFVFKPPFYNLDTRESRAYVLEDIDIISFTFTEAEPEVTMVKATASQFKNLGGTGTDGWIGKKGIYMDFRLVAQYGWREQTFETAYLSDPRAMYFACINRLDLFNLNSKRATCQIPMRPELRPGYPVYVRYLDCYFYLQSFNHSFSFGGQCTTSLNLVGRRAKFHAPGAPPLDGKKATVKDIDLSNPWLPPLPLEIIGTDGIPRLQGFPNVVMGLDTTTTNPRYWVVGSNIVDVTSSAQLQALLRSAISLGVLGPADTADGKDGWFDGPFWLTAGKETHIEIGTAEQLSAAFASDLGSATATVEKLRGQRLSAKQASQLAGAEAITAAAADAQSQIQQVIDAVLAARQTAMPDPTGTANYFDALLDLKAKFDPYGSMGGYFRYYSSSHPDAGQQGMNIVVGDQDATGTTQSGGLAYLENSTTVFGFANLSEGVEMTDAVEVRTGIPLMRPNTGKDKTARAVPTPTHQIVSIGFAQHNNTVNIEVPRFVGDPNPTFPPNGLSLVMYQNFMEAASASGSGATVEDKFKGLFTQYFNDFLTITRVTGLAYDANGNWNLVLGIIYDDNDEPINEAATVEEQFSGDEQRGNDVVATTLAVQLALLFSEKFQDGFAQLVALYGKPGDAENRGSLNVSLEEKAAKFADLARAWDELVVALALDKVADPAQAQSDGLVVYVTDTSSVAQYSPVYPVSDANGYTVIGAYAYGRGLTIEPGGTMDQLVNSEPYGNLTTAEIEEFVLALANAGTPTQALALLTAGYGKGDDKRNPNPELAADIAAKITSYVEENDLIVDESGEEGTMFDKQFRAFADSSRQFSQKLSVQNAAYGLADMGLTSTTEVCECKGAEADVLLAAFSEEFVAIGGVQDWLEDQTAAAGVSWKTSQDALRGRVLDTGGSDLFDAFQAAGKAYGIGPQNAGEGIGATASQGLANVALPTNIEPGEEV